MSDDSVIHSDMKRMQNMNRTYAFNILHKLQKKMTIKASHMIRTKNGKQPSRLRYRQSAIWQLAAIMIHEEMEVLCPSQKQTGKKRV